MIAVVSSCCVVVFFLGSSSSSRVGGVGMVIACFGERAMHSLQTNERLGHSLTLRSPQLSQDTRGSK